MVFHIARLKLALLILSPCCWSWSKATDFAAHDSKRMHTLIQEHASQSKLMVEIINLVAVFINYDGHILRENPIHSKFWKQDFVKQMSCVVDIKYVSRTFLLNYC